MRLAAAGLARHGLGLLLGLYLVLAMTTLTVWTVQGNHHITGDEPWYLIQADGLVQDGTFAFEAPLQRELAQRRFYLPGLEPFDPADPARSHSLWGPHGLYSFHSPGLSVALALPVALGRWVGDALAATPLAQHWAGAQLARAMPELFSRFVLVAFNGGLLLWVAWCFAGQWLGARPGWRLAAVGTLSLSLPLLPAAGQIFPDLPAGVLCLWLLYWVHTIEQPRRWPVRLAYGLALVALPWLHIRFSLPAGVLALGLLWRGRALGVSWQQCLWPLVALAASGLGLAAYNLHAYGHPVSGFGSGFMQYNLTAIAIFLGLQLDQNQGLLLQNPLLWLGALGLVALWRQDARTACVLVLTYLALLALPAAHAAAPYGGWSFSGRFGWAAALQLYVPTLAALGLLVRWAPRCAALVLAAAGLLQASRYLDYTLLLDRNVLYNRFGDTWLQMPNLDGYPIFHAWLAPALPVFLGPRDQGWGWVFGYLPNLAFVLALGLVVLAGVPLARAGAPRLRACAVWLGAALGVVVLGALLAQPPAGEGAPPLPGTPLVWTAERLAGSTGVITGGVREAEPGRDAAGALVLGEPRYQGMAYPYALSVTYRSSAPAAVVVGTLAIQSRGLATRSTPWLAQLALPGTAGQWATVQLPYPVTLSPRQFQAQVDWPGAAPLAVQSLRVRRLDP